MTRPLFTVGYEAATLPQVIGALTGAGVALVADVRAVASSRRAGFSKSALAASLAEAGIDYLHLRDLGTPKPGREAARAGRVGEMRAIFAAHLEEPAAVAAMARLDAETGARPTALLCFEADPQGCHRLVLAERLEAQAPREVVHLRPAG